MKERKYPRLEAALPIRYRFLDNSEMTEASTGQVSAGGLCFTIKESFFTKVPLQVEIQLPGIGLPISAATHVIWQKKCEGKNYLTGVEFTNISEADRSSMSQYVTEAAK